MNEPDYIAFLTELSGMKDNKAIAYYLQREAELTTEQKVSILTTYLIQCIQKIAGLEHALGRKV